MLENAGPAEAPRPRALALVHNVRACRVLIVGSAPGSLRERQRQQILGDLHESAVAVVERVGFTGATIDLIAGRAKVSRRTFFNYYASKEDAVLGTTAPKMPEQALAAFVNDIEGDQFTRILRLIIEIIRSTYVLGVTADERRRLVDSYPQLRERMAQHVSAAESLTETALSERLKRSGSQAGSAESSRALLMLASTVLRYAHSNDPGALESNDSAAIEAVVSVFRDALEDIS